MDLDERLKDLHIKYDSPEKREAIKRLFTYLDEIGLTLERSGLSKLWIEEGKVIDVDDWLYFLLATAGPPRGELWDNWYESHGLMHHKALEVRARARMNKSLAKDMAAAIAPTEYLYTKKADREVQTDE